MHENLGLISQRAEKRCINVPGGQLRLWSAACYSSPVGALHRAEELN